MTQLIFGAVQLGLIYALMAMGNYISFRILNIPDLTVDGSFALGMAVSVMTAAGGHPHLALFAAIIAGARRGIGLWPKDRLLREANFASDNKHKQASH